VADEKLNFELNRTLIQLYYMNYTNFQLSRIEVSVKNVTFISQ